MIQKYLKQLTEKVTEHKFIKQEVASWETKRTNNLNMATDLESARSIIQLATQLTQQQLSDQISEIVSKALAAVFDDPYEFKIKFEKRRNSTECDLLFAHGDQEMKPLDSCGYGAADVASFALRIAYWRLDENARNTIASDEIFRNLSAFRSEKASLMIKKLSKKLNLQFILVTHNLKLAEHADRIFEVSKSKYSHISLESH